MFGEEVPKSVLGDQRLTGMSSGQNTFPIAGTLFNFKQHGESGAWMSDLMPYTSKIVDELCFIKSMYTEAINHDPAITMIQTGSELPGRPSIGSWLSYGLGTDNKNLPEFVVLITKKENQDNQSTHDYGVMAFYHQNIKEYNFVQVKTLYYI